MFLPPNFSSTHNSHYERIVLLKLTWEGNKIFKKSYNLAFLIPEVEKNPSVIVNSLFWDEKYHHLISNLYLISISVSSET